MLDAELRRALRAQARLAIEVDRDPRLLGDAAALKMLAELQEAQAVRDRQAEAATTGWLRSVLLERQGDRPGAIGVLKSLRDNRDLARSGTTEPGLRPYVTGLFPALAARLANLLYETKAPDAEIFAAIEWGKGRAITDTWSNGRIPSADELARLLRGRRIHYLSFLQDEKVVFAAFLTCDGTLTTRRIVLEADSVSAAQLIMIRKGGRLVDWQPIAEPLTAWLPAPAERSQLQEDDVLLISPHGPLHSLPLHALPADDGKPLAPRLAVIRTHGVAAVAAALGPAGATPQRALAVRAPRSDERGDPQLRDDFDGCVEALRAVLPTDRLEDEEADADALWVALKPGSLLHLMAHGDYDQPDPEVPPRFYDRSGVVLSHGGRLWPGEDAAVLRGPHLFSPKSLDQRRAGDAGRLRGVHVTLLACVSGHSRANPQGDAVGLEWAFLLGGAASVLSSHWHVEATPASTFCAAFYEAWLGSKRQSRVRAWQAAVRRIIDLLPGEPICYAFSLSGDGDLTEGAT